MIVRWWLDHDDCSERDDTPAAPRTRQPKPRPMSKDTARDEASTGDDEPSDRNHAR